MTGDLSPAQLIEWARQKCFIDEGGCWQYLGGRTSSNYPVGYIGGVGVPLRRVIYNASGRCLERGQVVTMTCGENACLNQRHMVARAKSYDRKGKKRNASTVSRLTLAQRRRSKLDLDTVRAIRERAAAGEFQRDMAAEYGISPSSVSAIVMHKIWREVSPWAI